MPGIAISDALGPATDAHGFGGALDVLPMRSASMPATRGASSALPLVGMRAGGLPDAVMGVFNGLAGGSLSEPTRGAIADTFSTAMQPLATLALDQFAGRIPGANASMQDALAGFARGALTDGRASAIRDIEAIARSLTGVQSAARGVFDGVTRGDFSSAAAAASTLDSAPGGQLGQARDIADTLSGGGN